MSVSDSTARTEGSGSRPIGVDDDFAVLDQQIHALLTLGENDDVADEDVYDFSIRWGTALAGRLPRLAHYSALHELDAADERHFQSLRAQLDSMRPLMRRFSLATPALGHDD
ncbi:hypothetical protein G4X40_11895 [Rhodococcus sp. D2-41]|uniref:hypothetical protein n=1 Tax=Speluncibacter jeojiensis TaxID=2710754 RepID=UPI00240FD815|nr:hypothetical protein [Rhodococcus sp. D2-41]MDG3010851.1 hypothetical protein [Rhodococcus sp. D2-41]